MLPSTRVPRVERRAGDELVPLFRAIPAKYRQTCLDSCVLISVICGILLFIAAYVLFTQPASHLPAVEMPTRQTLRPSSEISRTHSTEKLGSSTWFLLHSIADKYPIAPTPEDKRHFISLIRNLEYFYPCKESKQTWAHIRKMPVLNDLHNAVESRELLLHWLCSFHNLVNVWLSKPEYTCSAAAASAFVHDDGDDDAPTLLDSASPGEAEQFGYEESALEQLLSSLQGPCRLPIGPTLFQLQHDPTGEFGLSKCTLGSGSHTILYFTSRMCSQCQAFLQHFLLPYSKYKHFVNVVVVFEWSVQIPPRQERLRLRDQISDMKSLADVPILYEARSGEGSWYSHFLAHSGGANTGVPLIVVLKGCSVVQTYNTDSQDKFLQWFSELTEIPTLAPMWINRQ